VLFSSGSLATPLLRGEALLPGNHIPGPAVIVRSDTTLLLGPQDQADVDSFGNVLIEVGR
jgi:N-methylhydantoinase A/oxoprolinase/acetone carboxylase beta subunit